MTRAFSGLATLFVVAGLLSACSARDNAGMSATDAAETTGPASDAEAAPPLEPAVPPTAPPPVAAPSGAPIPSTPPIVPPEGDTPAPSTDAPPASTTPR